MLFPLLAEERGGRAEYVGGTVAALPGRSPGVIRTTSQQFMWFQTKAGNILVPYARVNLLEYGQKVDRRYVLAILISPLLLFSKKRQHFLTVGYTDEEGRQQAAIFRVNKSDVRAVLVSLEVKTGRKVEYQDEEARKAGKG
jgi:hypothetical protein